jgi:hypothetical protein
MYICSFALVIYMYITVVFLFIYLITHELYRSTLLIWVRRGGCIGSWWGNRREGDHWGDPGVDGWIIWVRRRGV